MRSRLAVAATTLIATFLLAGCHSMSTADMSQGSTATEFVANLSSQQEVPPVKSDATGTAWFSITKTKDGQPEILYRLSVKNINNVIMAHLHIGSANENGMHVAWLYPTNAEKPSEVEGHYTGLLTKGVITKDNLVEGMKGQSLAKLIDDMRHGKVYVNVHTKQNPSGEIRGQLRPANKK